MASWLPVFLTNPRRPRRGALLLPWLGALAAASLPAQTAPLDDAVDVAAGVVLRQLRAASLPTSEPVPSAPDEPAEPTRTVWTSQPGLLQTWIRSNAGPRFRRAHKLYSAPVLVIDDLAALAADRPADWTSRPAAYADLNAPVSDGQGGVVYPVVDPRADAEGFSFTPTAGANPLPLPVAWLYVTHDGTLGPLDAEGRFVPVLNTRTGTARAASADNPLVARVAFWTDDATCKINVNTASEGVFWDTPRCDTTEERAYATSQPARGEWQRDMGHPAAVCLSSVLFPGQRLHLPDTTSALAALPLEDARRVWRVARGIPDAGSLGGTQRVDPSPAGNVEKPIDRLYTAVAEVAATGELLPAAVARLARGGFFLTTESRAPDFTAEGLPRVTLWPVDRRPSRHTEFDSLIAARSSLPSGRGLTKAFTRRSPDSRYTELDINRPLWEYLQQGPGRETIFSIHPPTGALGFNLADKYRLFPGSGIDDFAGITLNTLEYIRETNPLDVTLPPEHRYAAPTSTTTLGQILPLYGRTDDSSDFTVLGASPLAMGRFPTVSEVSVVFALRAKRLGETHAGPAFMEEHEAFAQMLGPSMDHYEVEVGFLVETFIPAHSMNTGLPDFALALGGLTGVDEYAWPIARPLTPTPKRFLVISGDVGNTRSALLLNGRDLWYDETAITSSAKSSIHTWPTDWTGTGGPSGARILESLISFHPVLISVPHGLPPPAAINFSGTGAHGANAHFRLFLTTSGRIPSRVYGESKLALSSVQQVIPLAFPNFIETGSRLFLDTLPQSLANRWDAARRDSTLMFRPDGLIREGQVLKSLVPVHGDFRLLAGHKRVLGISPSSNSTFFSSFPFFVPNQNYLTLHQSHSLSEPLLRVQQLFNEGVPNIRPASRFSYFDPDETAISYPSSLWADYALPPWNIGYIQSWANVAPLASGALSGGWLFSLGIDDLWRDTRADQSPDGLWRGVARPDVTGDFDNGIAGFADGPYINAPDVGDARAVASGGTPYFDRLEEPWVDNPGTFSPYRHVPSAVMLGSLPTGVEANVPWQTLLFRPDPHRGTPQQHWGSRGVPDHVYLDAFRMPVVKPSTVAAGLERLSDVWTASDTFSTVGRINLNHRIEPFAHVRRTTALHALLKAQKLLAIPDAGAATYKTGAGDQPWRHHLDATQTLRQWEAPWREDGRVFLQASEICEQWLVPEGKTLEDMATFWQAHRPTGDNSKERPYAHLYPHLTTRSLSYEMHVLAETIAPAEGGAPDRFRPGVDLVTGRAQRMVAITGRIDPADPGLPDYVSELARDPAAPVRPLTHSIHWRADLAAMAPARTPSITRVERVLLSDPDAPERVELRWEAGHDQVCEVEVSTDLYQWRPLGFFNAGESVDLTDGSATLLPSPTEARLRLRPEPGRPSFFRLRWAE